jgi:hypothetical protein
MSVSSPEMSKCLARQETGEAIAGKVVRWGASSENALVAIQPRFQ